MAKIIGVNKRNLPTEQPHSLVNQRCQDITVVLVEGTIGDYSAYYGVGSDEWVAAHGNKLHFTEAQAHFPSIEKSKYRN